MKRTSFAVLFLLLFASQAYAAGTVVETAVAAGGEKHMSASKVMTISWTANSNQTVNSNSIDLWGLRQETAFFGVQYAITSAAGSVSLTSLNYQCSNDDTNFSTPDGVSNLVGAITDENWHYVSLKPAPCRYMRFTSVTAAGSNADTVVTLKLYLR